MVCWISLPVVIDTSNCWRSAISGPKKSKLGCAAGALSEDCATTTLCLESSSSLLVVEVAIEEAGWKTMKPKSWLVAMLQGDYELGYNRFGWYNWGFVWFYLGSYFQLLGTGDRILVGSFKDQKFLRIHHNTTQNKYSNECLPCKCLVDSYFEDNTVFKKIIWTPQNSN